MLLRKKTKANSNPRSMRSIYEQLSSRVLKSFTMGTAYNVVYEAASYLEVKSRELLSQEQW